MPLLAGLLLVGCQERHPPAPAEPPTFDFPFPRSPGRLQTRLWYRVQLQGQPAGWQRVEIFSVPAKGTEYRLVREHTEVRLRLREQDFLLAFIQQALVDSEDHLLRLSYEESERGQPPRLVQAGRRGNQWLVVRGEETLRLPLRREAVQMVSYARLFGRATPEPGEQRDLVTFSASRGCYLEQTLNIGPRRQQEGRKLLSARLVDKNGLQKPVQLLLDEHLLPWRLRLELGRLRLDFERHDGPLKGTAGVADISALESVPGVLPWRNSERVERVLYRLHGLPESFTTENLNGPGQRFLGHPRRRVFLVEVRRQSAPRPVARGFSVPAALKRYLRPSAMLPLDDPSIKKAAADVLAAQPDAWQAARALRRFVSREIDAHRRLSFVPADRVLAAGHGDCAEQSVLLVALLREAQIPARAVLGLVWQRGAFWKHMWVEAWLAGGWYTLDPAQQRDAIDVRWIRLGWLPLGTGEPKQRQRALEALASDLRVEVVEYQQGP